MAKRRILRWSVILAILATFVIWLEPTRVVWGWLRREAFYQGRPTSYWAAQIEPWDSYCPMLDPRSPMVHSCYVPRSSRLRTWLKRHVNIPAQTWPTVLDGDPEARAVLQQLHEHPDVVVREWAQQGISRIGTQDKGPKISALTRLDGIPNRKMPGIELGLEEWACRMIEAGKHKVGD
jgi:hypothetical protein